MTQRVWRYDGTSPAAPYAGWREIIEDLPLTGGTMTGPVLFTDGTLGAPGIAFSSDTDVGVRRSAANTLQLVTGAAAALTATSSDVTIPGTLTHGGQTHMPHHIGPTAPANPDIGWTWLDTSNNLARFRTYQRLGDAYYTLAGTEYVNAPDSATLDITGDIEIVMRVRLTDWSPASEVSLAGKWGVASNASWRLRLLTSGKLRISVTTDGSTVTNTSQTAAAVFVDNTTYWIKVTLDVVNGGNRVANFYYSSLAQGTEPRAHQWTLIETVTTAGTTSIFSGTSALGIGSDGDGGSPFTGRIYRCIVRNGIGGTLAADFNPGDCPQSSTTTWASLASTGETWTTHNTPTLTRHSFWKILSGDLPTFQLHSSATYSTDGTNPSEPVWAVEDSDTDGVHASSDKFITIPTGLGGWWNFSYSLTNPSDTASYGRQSWIDVNVASGTTPTSSTGRRWAGSFYDHGATASASSLTGSSTILVSPGDVVRVKVYQNSGGAKTFGFASREDLNHFSGVMLTNVP